MVEGEWIGASPKDAEIACATLVRRVEITTSISRPTRTGGTSNSRSGHWHRFRLRYTTDFQQRSEGQFQVPPSKRLSRLDRKIMKGNRPRSNNKTKDQIKRQKEYEKLTNKKKDITAQNGKCYHEQLSGMFVFRTKASTLGTQATMGRKFNFQALGLYWLT